MSGARPALFAWAEVLRAPLLLSPAADVLAGWCLAFGTAAAADPAVLDGELQARLLRASLGTLLAAIAIGTCLLAAGMAQNAVADLADDRLRKPGRPLPRGALAPAAVRAVQWALWLAALLLAANVGGGVLFVTAGIIVLTGAYHRLLKPFRVPGCLVLGMLRGLDMLLGLVAVAAFARRAQGEGLLGAAFWPSMRISLIVAGLYGAFMFGASLHASTDDEAGTPGWSRAGLLLARLVLLALGPVLLLENFGDGRREAPFAFAGLLLLLVAAVVRLSLAARRLPPPALTGAALSSLYLIDAAVCLGSRAQPLGAACGMLALALFGASRLMLRVFAPT